MTFSYRQTGFTLLEMVLVLLIMGMVASLSMVFIDNEDGQLRYEETVHKLEIMQKVTVKVKEYKTDFLLSGFIVDNGLLPTSASNYVSQPAGWVSRQLFNDSNKPQYRIKDDESYAETGDMDGFIFKGYRNGYITTGVDSAGDYKTGWGFDFTVAEIVANNNLNLSYDETLNPDAYSQPVNRDVPADNWSLVLSEIDITVDNQSINDIQVSTTPLTIALVVFRNVQVDLADTDKTNDSIWQTYHFTLTNDLAAGDKHNSITNGAAWKNEEDDDATSLRIPAGDHVIFVGVDSPSNGNIEPSEIQNTAILRVVPRFTLLPVELVID